MVVKNLPDRYTAYCHRCHEGAVHLKEHCALTPITAQAKFMPWPEDAIVFERASAWNRSKVYEFLITKGIDYQTMLAAVPMYYSHKQQRLIIATAQGWIGRALRNQVPKWCTYGDKPAVYGIAPGEVIKQSVVLVEDYLSKLKGQWAVPEFTWIACLGTSLHAKLVAALLGANVSEVRVMFDGDKAGLSGYQNAFKRLRGLGFDVRQVKTPVGCDPKDLQWQALRDLVVN